MRVAELRRHAQALGFTPADQVRWLAPAELARTAIKVVLSSVFADYSDRREVQAALPKPPLRVTAQGADGSDGAGALWMDFVADLGDGFDATYTVALMLAQERLEVDGLTLPRGALLVLGGDEVYPTPSAVGYEDRTKGPYRAALPAAHVPAGRRPLLLALPGNHDWYDGLTAFLRLFAQRLPLGAWRTEQTRSYFAVELPNRWWLVGIDTQLGNYIDAPQIQYFREHLSAKLRPGDAVIVCSPSPTWVATAEGHPEAFDSLLWFEQHVIEEHAVDDAEPRRTGATVRLRLTGDRHHYARYAEHLPAGPTGPAGPSSSPGDSGRQFITCGLGGGYLSDTHRLPEQLELPAPSSRVTPRTTPSRFALAARYPSAAVSRTLLPRLLSFGRFGVPMRNPGFWRLCGVVQAFAVLLLASVLGVEQGTDLVGALRGAAWPDVLRLAGQTGAWWLVAVLVAVIVPLVHGGRPRAPSEVFLAVALQLMVAFASLTVAVTISWPVGLPPWLVLGATLLGTGIAGGLLASYAFAGYVLLSRNPIVRGWQMSAQAIEEYKGFLRLRFDADGSLTVHPIVVDQVCHDWTLDGDRPVPTSGLPVARLAEPPVRVTRTAAG